MLTLNQFTGTEKYYKHWTNRIIYTDGIQYLAEKAGAYWLVDTIASYQKDFSDAGFQVWTLSKYLDDSAVLTMKEDSGEPDIVRQEIGYTDFPLESIRLWVSNGVLMLPSEY